LWSSNLNIGKNYYGLNEFKQAIEYFESALSILGVKKSSDSIEIYSYLAKCNMEVGDFEKAVDFSKKSINIKADQYDMNSAKNSFASILLNTKDSFKIKEAIKYSKEVLRLSEPIRDDVDNYENALIALNILAKAYRILNELDLALGYYEKSLEIVSKSDTVSIAILLSNIALIFKDQNKQDLSIDKQNVSLDLFQQYYNTKYQYDYAANYENLADVYTVLQRYEYALKHYQKALINLTNNFRNENIFQNPNPKDTVLFIYSNPDMIRVLHLKASAAYKYYQQNKEQKYLTLANQTYQTAFDFHDELQKDISTENSRLFQAKNFMEKNKATVLLQSMNEADALQFANLPDSLLEQEKDLKITITFHKKQLNEAIEYEDSTEIERLDKLLFEEKQQYNQLINNLEDNYPDYYRLKYQQNQTQLVDVQNTLDDKTALLEYFVGDSAIYVLSIQKNHSRLYEVKKPNHWKTTIKDFRQSITNPFHDHPALFVKSADSLYQLLLSKPLCDLQADITRLQIIPDGELNYVPFEILLMESTTKSNILHKELPYLLKTKSVGYAYSAALLLESIETTATVKTYPYGGYAPIYYKDDTSFYDLPITRDKVKSLADLLNGKAYLSEQATLQRILEDW